MIGSAIKSGRLFLYRTKANIQNKTIVHFLHIGKSGGTAIKSALGNKDKPLKCNDSFIFSHPHNFTLMHTHKGEKVFIMLNPRTGTGSKILIICFSGWKILSM